LTDHTKILPNIFEDILAESTGHRQNRALIGVAITELSDIFGGRENRAVVSVVVVEIAILLDKFVVQGKIKPEKAEWITIPIFIELDGVILKTLVHALVISGGCIE